MKSKTSLRRAERDDLDVVISWMQDPDYLHFLYGDPASSPKQVRENIVAMLSHNRANQLPSSIHLIADHSEQGPIGLVSLQHISWRNRSCNVDFYMGQKSLRGRLEVGAALYRMTEYCFDELNLHRFTAYVYAFNTRSWHFLERVGAQRELVHREHVFRDGQAYDLYAYGLLRQEFNDFRKQATHLQPLSLEDMIARLEVEGLAEETAS